MCANSYADFLLQNERFCRFYERGMLPHAREQNQITASNPILYHGLAGYAIIGLSPEDSNALLLPAAVREGLNPVVFSGFIGMLGMTLFAVGKRIDKDKGKKE